jgi:hypothetical protein
MSSELAAIAARRRRAVNRVVGIVVLLLVGLFSWWFVTTFLPWDSYKYDIERLRGKTAEQVISELGPPMYDSRPDALPTNDPGEFVLGYSGPGGGFGMRYTDYFKRGTVESVAKYMK